MSGSGWWWPLPESPFKKPATPAAPGTSAEDAAAVTAERERIERRRRGRGGTILTSPTGAPLGLPGTAPKLTGGATILGG